MAHTEEHKRNLKLAWVKRKENGLGTPWNKGVKTGIAPWLGKKRPDISGANNWQWKENSSELDYTTIHQWVYRGLGKPEKCEHCGTDGLKGYKIHWANKSGEYKRDFSDWIRLCAKCHAQYDMYIFKSWATRKNKILTI